MANDDGVNDLLIAQPAFGERLRALRRQQGLSQKELAGTSMTASYISLLENGSRVPSLDVVLRLARLLKTTPQELLGRTVDGLVSPPLPVSVSDVVSQIGARRMVEIGDLTGARRILDRELSLLREQNGNEERLVAFGVGLVDVLTASGEHAERMALLDELVALPVVQRSPDIHLVLLIDRAATFRELGRMRDALVVAQQAARLLDESALRHTTEHVRLLGVLASVHTELRNFGEAERVTTEMVEEARLVGDLGTLGRSHWAAAMVYSRLGNVEQARRELAEAHETLASGSMLVRDWLRFCRFTASVLIDHGVDLDEARQWLEAAEVTARMAGTASDYSSAMRERAHYELATGNYERAAVIYAELVETEDMVGNEFTMALTGLGEAQIQLDQTASAVQTLRRAAQLYERDGNYRKATELWRRIDELQSISQTTQN